ncbi:MAG TPA: M56 family metallopeptidase, partial [Planctomycetaceae bacterium]|nr:M56 family metallopeptidase [Planctomycetaceae bacterium]
MRIELSEAPTRLLEGWNDRLRRYLTWIVAIWGVGVGLLSLRLTYGWRTIRRLRASAGELVDPIWTQRFTRLRERLGVSAPVRLLSSTAATVPLVVGSLKPAILVPASLLTGLSTSQIEALLVHELVHIRRHDYIVNLAQNLLETLFFYHPAVWWVSRQIRKEREHCCDDVASAACGALDYAQALASLAELRQASPGFGLAANSTPLVDRIRRLAGVNPSPQRTAGWLAILALVALITAIALRPADRTHADGQETKTVKGTVIDANGRPVAEAEVIAESHHVRCGSAQTNGQGEFQMPVPTKMAIDAYRVSVPHWFEVSFTLDKRAPLALSIHRFAASATVEKQEPLVLKVKSPYPWGGYLPPSKGSSSPRATGSGRGVRKIAGRVVDHEGKPISNARLWWVVLDDFAIQRKFTVEGTTDAKGRFQIEAPSDWKPRPPQQRRADTLWILSPGKDLRIADAADGLIDTAKSSGLIIQVGGATETTYQVKDSEGRPVMGALVEPWHFHTLGHRFAFLPDGVREALRGTTDASGRVRVHWLPRQELFDIRVTASGFGAQTLRLDGDDVAAAERTITLRAVSRIEGRLIADDSQTTRGIKMVIETKAHPEKTVPSRLGSNTYSWIRETEGASIVTTDQAGRFVVPAIADGMATIAVLENPAKPAFLPRL